MWLLTSHRDEDDLPSQQSSPAASLTTSTFAKTADDNEPRDNDDDEGQVWPSGKTPLAMHVPPHEEHLKTTEPRRVWLKDSKTGKTVMLRGVNLSGSCKLPSKPNMPSHEPEGFFNDRDVSFVGRPFPLDESDEHLSRLRQCGFNFLRYLVTWEALEHEGPGIYDFEYMDYVVKVLLKAKQYGFKVFIDPHQDVWSRFSGGSGAPGWTLRAAGLNPSKFNVTHAAIVHNTYEDPSKYPKMIWPTNYFKLATATMFTLFYAGATFAPKCTVEYVFPESTTGKPERVNIQHFLQSHYLRALVQLSGKLREAGLHDEVVVGYDTLNEPSGGWIGVPNLGIHPATQVLKAGQVPTPFQAMMLGAGLPCEVERWELLWRGPVKSGTVKLDPKGETVWLQENGRPGGDCLWAKHGVWDIKTKSLLIANYFSRHPITGEKVDFLDDFYAPFVRRFASALRSVHPDALIFVEPTVFTDRHLPHSRAFNVASLFEKEKIKWEKGEANQESTAWDPMIAVSRDVQIRNVKMSIGHHAFDMNEVTEDTNVVEEHHHHHDPRLIYAPHFYDGLTLLNKSFNRYFCVDFVGAQMGRYSSLPLALKFGANAIRKCFGDQIALLKADGETHLGPVGVIIGEIGIPMDLDNRVGYYVDPLANSKSENGSRYESQEFALDVHLQACEAALVMGYTAWTYCSDNTHKFGDGWNGEDLSLFSRDGISTDVQTNSGVGFADGINHRKGLGNDVVLDGFRHDPALDLGARALRAFVRPYAVQTPGIPLRLNFVMSTGTFAYSFTHRKETLAGQSGIKEEEDGEVMVPAGGVTELFLPVIHFAVPKNCDVWVSHGTVVFEPELQRARWHCGCHGSGEAVPVYEEESVDDNEGGFTTGAEGDVEGDNMRERHAPMKGRPHVQVGSSGHLYDTVATSGQKVHMIIVRPVTKVSMVEPFQRVVEREQHSVAKELWRLKSVKGLSGAEMDGSLGPHGTWAAWWNWGWVAVSVGVVFVAVSSVM
ncbi:hypothetical protein HDU76_002777 [Blyttiomyces sp. JEL0837]|nr:hypothetical protein HDU76_002777 [Blyttiomyces sp. JEL0837]